jgi:hypothetical protein
VCFDEKDDEEEDKKDGSKSEKKQEKDNKDDKKRKGNTDSVSQLNTRDPRYIFCTNPLFRRELLKGEKIVDTTFYPLFINN